MLSLQAESMDEDFRKLSRAAKEQRIRRFIHAHKFSLRVGTHSSQVHSQVVNTLYPRITCSQDIDIFVWIDSRYVERLY